MTSQRHTYQPPDPYPSRDTWAVKLSRSQRAWMLARDARDTAYARLLDRLDAARKALRRLGKEPR